MEALPRELLKEIQNYLFIKEYLLLLNCKKDYFDMIKYETREIMISSLEIEKFIEDKEFRNFILQKMKDPKKQLSLFTSTSSFNRIETNVLAQLLEIPAKKIAFYANGLDAVRYWRDKIGEFQELELYRNNDVHNLGSLRNVQSLTLEKMWKCTDFTTFTHLKSLRLIGLMSTEINELNVNCLNTLEYLYIDSCAGIIDVSELGNVPYLSLIDLSSLSNISGLQNNKSLTILGCKFINNLINCFENVQELKTDLLHTEDQLTKIKQVTKLSVTNFQQAQCTIFSPSIKSFSFHLQSGHYISPIIFPSSLNYLQELYLSNCNIDSSSHPTYLMARKITLNYYLGKQLPNIDVQACKSIMLIYLPEIQDFSSLRGIPSITIDSCHLFFQAIGLEESTFVCLRRNFALWNISMLNNVKQLIIHSCPDVKELSPFPQLKTLEVVDCPSVSWKGLVSNGSSKKSKDKKSEGNCFSLMLEKVILPKSSKSAFFKISQFKTYFYEYDHYRFDEEDMIILLKRN